MGSPVDKEVQDALDRLLAIVEAAEKEGRWHLSGRDVINITQAAIEVRSALEQLTQDKRDADEHCDLLDAKLEATERKIARLEKDNRDLSDANDKLRRDNRRLRSPDEPLRVIDRRTGRPGPPPVGGGAK